MKELLGDPTAEEWGQGGKRQGPFSKQVLRQRLKEDPRKIWQGMESRIREYLQRYEEGFLILLRRYAKGRRFGSAPDCFVLMFQQKVSVYTKMRTPRRTGARKSRRLSILPSRRERSTCRLAIRLQPTEIAGSCRGISVSSKRQRQRCIGGPPGPVRKILFRRFPRWIFGGGRLCYRG